MLKLDDEGEEVALGGCPSVLMTEPLGEGGLEDGGDVVIDSCESSSRGMVVGE